MNISDWLTLGGIFTTIFAFVGGIFWALVRALPNQNRDQIAELWREKACKSDLDKISRDVSLDHIKSNERDVSIGAIEENIKTIKEQVSDIFDAIDKAGDSLNANIKDNKEDLREEINDKIEALRTYVEALIK